MRVRCMAALGEHAAALAELERMRQAPHHSDLVEGERLHAAACVVLEARDRALLADAEGACRAALERNPARDIKLTLAAVLIERERYREAEELLQGVFRATREPWLEDRCLAYLALTASALGRADDAARFRNAFEERSPNRRLRRRLAELP
jgi:tetratricopeptide (TPR) repeat protein